MFKLVVLFLIGSCAAHDSFRVMFQWNYIDFAWPTTEARDEAIQRGQYIAANNAITGIKIWNNKMYLAVPRLRDGVPVTLAVTSSTPVNGVTAPRLEAYPNWNMQKVGDCSAFQSVESMEIDPMGRMWVLDSGRTATLTLEAKDRCPPRLVILNLENGEVLRSYEFPQDVVRRESSYLNDIVVDHEDGGLAYISDSSRDDPGLIVFSLQNTSSWKVRHESMKAESEAVGFMVGKTHVVSPMHINGLALSPARERQDRQVYYSPLSSFHLYSLPTAVLKNGTKNVRRFVRELGKKNSQTAGMMMSSAGVLYFGLLADDAVSIWDSRTSFTTGQRVISRDHQLMQWPDSFAFDDKGGLYCVTNAMQNYLANRLDTTIPNYRIVKSNANSKSYQYYEDGRAPSLPEITAGSSRVVALTITLWTTLALLLV